jgi:hypothetical protein
MTTRGASRISADFYRKAGPFGLISAGFRPVRLRLAGYGVLTWRTTRNARYVFRPTAMFHAINRPFIPGSEWRAMRQPAVIQTGGSPISLPRRYGVQAATVKNHRDPGCTPTPTIEPGLKGTLTPEDYTTRAMPHWGQTYLPTMARYVSTTPTSDFSGFMHCPWVGPRLPILTP